MKFITLTRKQVRDVDRIAIEQFAMPGVVLMENAGRNAAAIIAQQISHLDTVTILCGSGNNGGDGYVIARHLVNHDFTVQLICAKPIDQLSGDAAINANIAMKMQIPLIELGALSPDHVVVDALLGTGFAGDVRKNLIPYILACNNKALVFAIDLPSGMDCDSGIAANVVVKADHTITFVGRKVGFDHPDSHQLTGKVHVVDIGVPEAAIDLAMS
ncbi:MAG TPA: NAD(P)H-hydrate epimerase [Phycisphaerales bacterium]|nr:NAD(P)H-hydrate epimerase [Phycisphaerales bacterium]HCD34754.1 NAD(P)H-hydrate epimerase [Phycisphaerales bacterium]